MLKKLAILSLILAPSSIFAGVVFFFTNVNINDGTLSIMRVTPSGSFELIEAVSVGYNLAQVTNHTAGVDLPLGKVKREISTLIQQNWKVNGEIPVRDGKYSIDTGNLPNLLMCTWSDTLVELRPLNQYTNLVFDFLKLQQVAEAKDTATNTGYILTPLYAGSVNDHPITITDPYGTVFIPKIGAVIPEDAITDLGGLAAMKMMGYDDHNVTLVTTPMHVRMEGTNTVLSTH